MERVLRYLYGFPLQAPGETLDVPELVGLCTVVEHLDIPVLENTVEGMLEQRLQKIVDDHTEEGGLSDDGDDELTDAVSCISEKTSPVFIGSTREVLLKVSSANWSKIQGSGASAFIEDFDDDSCRDILRRMGSEQGGDLG